MVTHTRIQELANNSEIENSRNKSHAKISEFTVFKYNDPKAITMLTCIAVFVYGEYVGQDGRYIGVLAPPPLATAIWS